MQMLPPTSCICSYVLRQDVINCKYVTYKILQELKCTMHVCKISVFFQQLFCCYYIE